MPDVSPLDVRKYYCAADFFLFPSEGDIWGLVVNEALSMHLPVVCTNVIGAAELVHDGENGFVVPPRAPQELAKAIHALAEDSALRKRMGESAFERIKSWNTRRGLENLKAYLERR
jgi:glycosyltransferase involved in cell wall biosynthesis